MKSTISVIMPNYNHAQFLPGAVNALVNQSVPPLDIVLIDDGSTDDSLTVMAELAAMHDCVTVVECGENLGTTKACALGLARAKGDYLFFAAADDLVLPGLFEKSLFWLTAHPESAVCCHTYVMYDVDTKEVKDLDYRWSNEARYFTPTELAEVLPGWSVQGVGSVFDRTRFEAIGGMHEHLFWHSDWFLIHVLAFRHGICYVPQPGMVRREHRDSYSQEGRRDWAKQKDVVRAIVELFLAEEYQDILPHVARSQLMGFFGDELSRLYYSDPTLWTSEVLTLVLPALQFTLSQGPKRRQLIYENLQDSDLKEFVHAAFSGL